MVKERVLAVDDEKDILELIKYNLEKEGLSVDCAGSGELALAHAKKGGINLIVLDLMLPGIDGFEVLRELRRDSKTSDIPVVILSAKGEDADIVAGLELGADDYLTKPFSPKVFIARLKSILRRRRKDKVGGESIIDIRRIAIDPRRRRVSVGGRAIDLTSTEFSILLFLARQPGWVFTRGQIIDAIKGVDYPVTERAVDVQIVNLRKKLGTAGEEIETVHGVGYRFRE